MIAISSLARKCSMDYARDSIEYAVDNKGNRGVTILSVLEAISHYENIRQGVIENSHGSKFKYLSGTNIHVLSDIALRDRASWMLIVVPGYVDDTTMVSVCNLFDDSNMEFSGCTTDYLSLVGWALFFGSRIDEHMAIIELSNG